MLWLSHKSFAMRRRWVEPNLETDLTILHQSNELSGRLRLVAIFLGIATRVAVTIFEINIVRWLVEIFLGIATPVAVPIPILKLTLHSTTKGKLYTFVHNSALHSALQCVCIALWVCWCCYLYFDLGLRPSAVTIGFITLVQYWVLEFSRLKVRPV